MEANQRALNVLLINGHRTSRADVAYGIKYSLQPNLTPGSDQIKTQFHKTTISKVFCCDLSVFYQDDSDHHVGEESLLTRKLDNAFSESQHFR